MNIKILPKYWQFLLLTFTMSYSLVGVYLLAGGSYISWAGIVLAVVFMFMPMASAIILSRFYKETVAGPLRIRFALNSWFAVGWILPLLLSALTFGISLLIPGIGFSPGMEGMFERFKSMMTEEQLQEMYRSMETIPVHPVIITILQGLGAGATINAVAGFGEESGWRGYLLRQLEGWSFWKASLFTGLVWGLWHAPLILLGHNYPEHPELGTAMMTLWCILLAPFFTYITLRSGSVIAASVMHGTLNATAGLAIMLIKGGNDLTSGMTGIPGMGALILALASLWIYDQYFSGNPILNKTIGEGWLREAVSAEPKPDGAAS